MDVESPDHLERLRDQPDVKVALLRQRPEASASEARFERTAKNALYWPAVERLAARFIEQGHAADLQEPCEFYGRPCWLLATKLAPADDAPYAIAVAASDGASAAGLVALLQDVSRDYWFGSTFFK
jgi:hypothetical protein